MNRFLPPISVADREHIILHSAESWSRLKGSRLFITGGTGFYGKWMLQAIAAANDELDTGIRATLLSRDPARFAVEAPDIARRPEFDWVIGDPVDCSFPTDRFDFLLDFATPSAAEIGAGGAAMIARCLGATQRLLKFAEASGVRRILYASSGAVYGRQPIGTERMVEDHVGNAATVSPYGKLKLRTETLMTGSSVECVIARGFAFLGPYLPLTDKFAAGSFLRDALAGSAIRIHGDGSQVRSYLYPADLAVWLVALLACGKAGRAYNVGSDHSVTLRDLAGLIVMTFGPDVPVVIGGEPQVSLDRYVPDIQRARDELGLTVRIPLGACISRSLTWLRCPEQAISRL